RILLVPKRAGWRSADCGQLAGSILAQGLPPEDLEARRASPATTTADKLRATGRWDPAWDSFFYLDPEWTDEVVAVRLGLEESGVMAPKLLALLSVAFYAFQGPSQPDVTRRHINAVMRASARPEEIIEVLKTSFVS